MDDDMFEPIQSSNQDDPTFFDKLDSNGRKLIQFQESQNQIRNSLNELQKFSQDLNQNSTINEIQECIQKISNGLEQIRENNIINGMIINQISEEHEKLQEEFSKMKSPDEIKAEIKILTDLIKNNDL